MKLSDYKQEFYTFSEKASDAARTAAFAGIALAWVFRIDDKPIPSLPIAMILPAGLFALGLALDLFQYVVAAAIWGIFHRYHEKKLSHPSEDPDLHHSPWLLVVINAIFISKLSAVMIGYLCILFYIVRTWSSVAAF
jgi:hypothetical protein